MNDDYLVAETFTLSHHSIRGQVIQFRGTTTKIFELLEKVILLSGPKKEASSLLEDKNLSFLDNRENKIQKKKSNCCSWVFF